MTHIEILDLMEEENQEEMECDDSEKEAEFETSDRKIVPFYIRVNFIPHEILFLLCTKVEMRLQKNKLFFSLRKLLRKCEAV